MSSLIKTPKSPYWYLLFKDPEKGWVKKSTELRHDDPKQTAQARALRAKWEAKEALDGGKGAVKEEWDWVEHWLQTQGKSDLTRLRYVTAWHWIFLWLTETGKTPQDIRYADGEAYVTWRMKKKKKSGKKAGRNTANYEVAILSQILNNAVSRGIATSNPLYRIKLLHDARKQKPPMTDEELLTALRGLKEKSFWMYSTFLIASQLGCRLRETRIHRSKINLGGVIVDGKKIPVVTLIEKGNKDYTIPIPTALMDYFRQMMKDKREWTHDFPFQPSRKLGHALKMLGLGHISAHSCRRTKATRLRDSGVPLDEAKRLISHSSSLTHELYVRHTVRPIAKYRDAGALPSV